MAIKVRYVRTQKVYLLLGVGYGAFKATRPSVLGGNLFPSEDKGQLEMVAVCDEKGDISWARTADVEVIEIDGKTPSELLS